MTQLGQDELALLLAVGAIGATYYLSKKRGFNMSHTMAYVSIAVLMSVTKGHIEGLYGLPTAR